MSKLVSKEISLDAIRSMSVEEQNGMLLGYVKGLGRQNEMRAENAEATKVVGKTLCILEERLEAGIKSRAFAPNKSLKEFFKDITKASLPNRGYTLKNVFGAFVNTDFITEHDYDVCSVNCLEIAGQIERAVRDAGGDLMHEAIKKAAHELTERGEKAAKNLREILASVKPVKKLTPAEALELFQQIADDGQLGTVLAELPDVFSTQSDDGKASSYISLFGALQRIESEHAEALDTWLAAQKKADAPLQVITAETPTDEKPAPKSRKQQRREERALAAA